MKKRNTEMPDGTFQFRVPNGRKQSCSNPQAGKPAPGRDAHRFDMTASEFSKIAGRLMCHPAAPFHEHAVRAEVEKICSEHRLDFKRNESGNIIVRLRTAPKVRPIVLAAHLD